MKFLSDPNITNFLVLIIIWFFILAIWRYRNGKKCKDNIYCEFMTDEGTGYHDFQPVIDGTLVIKPTKKRAGAMFPIGNINTMIVDYPEKVMSLFSIIQVKAKKSIFDERTAEPILNRSPMLLITPQRIANWATERYTALASGQSVVEERKAVEALNKAKGGGGSSISWGWVIVGILIVALTVGVVFYMKNQSVINAQLGK